MIRDLKDFVFGFLRWGGDGVDDRRSDKRGFWDSIGSKKISNSLTNITHIYPEEPEFWFPRLLAKGHRSCCLLVMVEGVCMCVSGEIPALSTAEFLAAAGLHCLNDCTAKLSPFMMCLIFINSPLPLWRKLRPGEVAQHAHVIQLCECLGPNFSVLSGHFLYARHWGTGFWNEWLFEHFMPLSMWGWKREPVSTRSSRSWALKARQKS